MSATQRKALKLRAWALFTLFFLPGLVIASWVTRTPAIRDTLNVSTSEMGIVLFGLSVGAMGGILCSGWLVKRFGTRTIIRSGMSLMVVGMLVISLALFITSPFLFAFGLAIMGAALGSSEVAMNVEGAIIEGLMKKTILPMMHGFYSLGTLVGAAIGMCLIAWNVISWLHLLVIGLLVIVPIAIALRVVPHGTGKDDPADNTAREGVAHRPFYKDTQLMLIGLIVLAMAFAEGSANDWLPLLMVDGHGFSPTSGSLIYFGFTLGMTIGRFTGGWFIDRYSRVTVVRACAIMGILGIGIVVFVDNDILAGISVLLWGLGTSLGFPLTISAAGDTGPDPATRVSVVATSGYIAFLVGPPLLGFLGEHYGLRYAMLAVLSLMVIASLIAKAVARPLSSAQNESVVDKG